jgi:hypothetical protein
MHRLIRLYKTSNSFIASAFVIEGLISYGFISLAIDRGNLWWYILAVIFLVRCIRDLVRLIGNFSSPWKKSSSN